MEHKQKLVSGFSSRYNIDRLVYYEIYGNVRRAITREKEFKGWRREKKIALIERENPTWDDLSTGTGRTYNFALQHMGDIPPGTTSVQEPDEQQILRCAQDDTSEHRAPSGIRILFSRTSNILISLIVAR